VLAGAVNGIILPLGLGSILLATHNKKVVGEDYKHPLILTILGWIVVAITAYLAIKALPNLKNLFV
jgi:Mn2+/Fe2+ NRAMP family transporter